MNIEERIKQRIEQIAIDKSASPSDWTYIEGYMLEGYKIAMEEYRSNLWTSPCICPNDEKTGETLCCNLCGKPTARTTSKELPRDEEMKDWAEIHAIHCYHDGLTSKKHFVEGYLYAVDFFKNNYALPLLASKDARIRELEEALRSIEIGADPRSEYQAYSWIDTAREIANKALTPPKN